MVELDPLVVAVVAAMALVTLATKFGGFWLLGRIDVGERTEAGLEALPGAIIVALVMPELADGGPPEWTAAALAGLVAWKTGNLLASLGVAMVVVVALRWIYRRGCSDRIDHRCLIRPRGDSNVI